MSLWNNTPMKEQWISNQTQSTTQQKKAELRRKMLKGIPNRVIYMTISTFRTKYENSKYTSCCLFSTKPPLILVGEKICWYGLLKYWFSIRQAANQVQPIFYQSKKLTIFFLFLERTYAQLSSFKMTYSNYNFLYI